MPRAIRLAPPRQARSRATHRRLLEACVEALVELGYAGTTTTEVCSRAGVSQGALFKHFPNKAALLAGTVAHLFGGLVEDYRRAFAAMAERSDRPRAAVELLWGTFQEPALHAAFELMVAARTDPELRAALSPVQKRHGENLQRLAAELFPEAFARDPGRFDAALETIVSAMQGATLAGLGRDDPATDRRLLVFLEDLARALVEPGSNA